MARAGPSVGRDGKPASRPTVPFSNFCPSRGTDCPSGCWGSEQLGGVRGQGVRQRMTKAKQCSAMDPSLALVVFRGAPWEQGRPHARGTPPQLRGGRRSLWRRPLARGIPPQLRGGVDPSGVGSNLQDRPHARGSSPPRLLHPATLSLPRRARSTPPRHRHRCCRHPLPPHWAPQQIVLSTTPFFLLGRFFHMAIKCET